MLATQPTRAALPTFAPAPWRAHLPPRIGPRRPDPHAAPKPPAITGTAEPDATIGRVAPAGLGLLADGVPRPKAAIVAALAGRHDRRDVIHALIRLAVTGRVEERDGKYMPGPAGGGS